MMERSIDRANEPRMFKNIGMWNKRILKLMNSGRGSGGQGNRRRNRRLRERERKHTAYPLISFPIATRNELSPEWGRRNFGDHIVFRGGQLSPTELAC